MQVNALENYTSNGPSLQNAVDIFRGEWSSAVPGALDSGSTPLFEDSRVTYWINRTNAHFASSDTNHSFKILELGPLEGGHSYMLANAGWHVTSVESNARAFLKTLIVYNHFGLNARALYGDFIPYLNDELTPIYDLTVACGVLYHMKNPIAAIDSLAAKSMTLGIWTHFVTDSFIEASPGRWHEVELEASGYSYNGFKQFYGLGLESNSFCGGGQDYAVWLRQEQIIDRLRHHGFSVEIESVQLDNVNGPCFTLYAARPNAVF